MVKENTAFLAGAEQGKQAANAQKTQTPWWLKGSVKRGGCRVHEQLMDILLIGKKTGWCFRNQYYQPFGSNWSAVSVLVGSKQLTSFTWWGFWNLQNNSRIWLRTLSRRLLRVPWTTRRSNQSILKEINPEYASERLMLKLNFQYFGHLMWRAYSLEKTPMLGKLEGRRRRGRRRTRRFDGITGSMELVWASSGRWWWTEKPGKRSPWGS